MQLSFAVHELALKRLLQVIGGVILGRSRIFLRLGLFGVDWEDTTVLFLHMKRLPALVAGPTPLSFNAACQKLDHGAHG